MDQQDTTTSLPPPTQDEPPHQNYAMRDLLSVHSITLAVLCGASLVMGAPLKAYILWHLRHAQLAMGFVVWGIHI